LAPKNKPVAIAHHAATRVLTAAASFALALAIVARERLGTPKLPL